MSHIDKLKTYVPVIVSQAHHTTLLVNNSMRNNSAISAVFKSCTDAKLESYDTSAIAALAGK